MDEVGSNGSSQANKILSLCWSCGTVAASYYDVDQLEIYAIQQAADQGPQYALVGNLIRQYKPLFYLVSGSKSFLEDVPELLGLPNGTVLQHINSGKITCEEKARYCDFGPKAIKASISKVLSMNLPGIHQQATESERRLYMESVLPFSQDLLIHSVGCLLKLLDSLASDNDELIVSKINVLAPETLLVIDELTYQALQIFDSRLHPSGFKRNMESSPCSLYNLYNRCSSRIGRIELINLMQKPIRNLTELNERLDTVEWLITPHNSNFVNQMKNYISNLSRIQPLYKKVTLKRAKNNEWKSLKRNIYYVYLLGKLCTTVREPSNDKTTIALLAEFVSQPGNVLKQLLYTLDEVLDLERGERDNKFTIKPGIDRELDGFRAQLDETQTALLETSRLEIENLPIDADDVFVTFLPGYGFVFSTTRTDGLENPSSIESTTMNVVCQSDTTVYFQNDLCRLLNTKFGGLLASISDHEQAILEKLVTYIDRIIPELLDIFNVSAKLDVMLAFASVAETQKYSRPVLCDRKVLQIKQGRHPLLELYKPYHPNDTDLSSTSNCLVKILASPDPSGKTVYLKEIALICYLAHIGSFVPAQAAIVGLLDSIYSRLDFPESVFSGKSSFMSELYQISNILSNTTSRSMVLIDEFGKGTTFSEGKSLLISSVEYLLQKEIEVPMTFVATQFTAISNYLRDYRYLRIYSAQRDAAANHNESTSDHNQHHQELIASVIQSLTLTLTKKFLGNELVDPGSVAQLYHSMPITQAPVFNGEGHPTSARQGTKL
ncbi:AAEL005494-PA [Aedes aegypti]|uniref:AAEL005494-PA n=1 Tax=Aedes aegypti TaxID=7159 RepID=Q179W4_AEDAE|nr:AAEL005494-PA [Aedes aegypti]